MEPTCWLIIRLSDNTIFGAQFDEPPDGAFNPGLFAVKPWFDTPPPTNDDINGILVPDPTLNNPDYDAQLANYNAAAANTGGAKQWLIDNPNGKLLYTMTIAEIEAEIDGLDLSPLPPATQAKLRLLWKTQIVSERVFARKLDLI